MGFVGSVDAVASGSRRCRGGEYQPGGDHRAESELLRVRKPGGVLLASGIESHELEALLAAVPTLQVRRKGNWALVVA